ncbi:hypothetical protein [Winogradskyella schleiferi]|uniref:hypothetical protein n=1 Tax=Winogradskyella schleiferi TaxID=2686078 RepID=UPI0015B834E2|nr:hypothetical protein [Winogradskyella schleiferi]
MAPIKFEENIKDKLEKRTLSPTSESWSKLSGRLDDDEKKSKKSMFWWLSIAAGLLIMMAISIQFFNTNDAEELMPKIVEEGIIKEQINIKTEQPDQKESIELVNEENRVEEKEEIVPMPKESKTFVRKSEKIKNTESKIQLAEINETDKNEIPIIKDETVNNELQLEIDDLILKNAVTAAMKTLKSENSSVTDREIDSLLKIASKELFKENLKKETIKLTDADALLMSVEDEMGQSFRTKVFEALKDSYETVKTAVADRNN